MDPTVVRMYPWGLCPALELDDGTVIHEAPDDYLVAAKLSTTEYRFK